MELDWFKEYFINTTLVPDYGIDTVIEVNAGSGIILEKIGHFPMPLDIRVTQVNGEVLNYNIPLRIMRGQKRVDGTTEYLPANDWPWTHPAYRLDVPVSLDEIKKIEIDPTLRMMDGNREDNVYDLNNDN